jgi:malonyl CoA-acyl carrier protein transacylase
LYDIYKPFVEPFLASATKYLDALATKSQAAGHAYYAHGLDVISWLNGSSARPPVEYLASIPVSMPLIGLTQLVQYLISCKVSDLTPGEMRSRFRGATGHSQGIVAAVAVASSDSFDSFDVNALKALRQLFYLGLRGQDFFPLLALEPKLVEDAEENGEGVPTNMMIVNGMRLTDLENQVAKTNKHLPENSQIYVSLHNGPRNYVVTGPAKALYGFGCALRSVKAPAGLDQSKVPFSKRKMVFTNRFMPINVPYHSPYLQGATQKLVEEDLQGEELWQASEIKLGLYHTESGKLSSHLARFPTNAIYESTDPRAACCVIFSRREPSEPLDFHHRLVVRPDLHRAYPLAKGDRLPSDCYPCG